MFITTNQNLLKNNVYTYKKNHSFITREQFLCDIKNQRTLFEDTVFNIN